MKIKMLKTLAGPDQILDEGKSFELPDDQATALCDAGYAVAIEAPRQTLAEATAVVANVQASIRADAVAEQARLDAEAAEKARLDAEAAEQARLDAEAAEKVRLDAEAVNLSEHSDAPAQPQDLLGDPSDPASAQKPKSGRAKKDSDA